MSASSKKKLRKEQEAAKLTEKQLTAQKEAKKNSLYTTIFVVVMAAILVIALVIGVTQTITGSGIREKNTIALTVGEHEINSVEMNYFFMDAVNNFYSSYGSYAGMFGLDLTKPLNEQFVDEESGTTWADDFMNSAKESAASVYAMADAAKAAGFTLPEESKAAVENNLASLDLYAAMYGYGTADAYLKAMYGNGASKESFTAYNELQALASAYYNHYSEGLTYEDADLRAKEAENFNAYSSYTYNYYYLAASRFLTGGTTDAEGSTTYTDEETAASVSAAEEAAKALTAEEITDAASFDAAIAALEINKDSTAASTLNTDTLYSSINSTYADWLADSSRKAGDIAYFPSVSGETTNGYYVVMFQDSTENDFQLKNVRHILVAPAHEHAEGETHEEGETYSEEELAEAKATAEEILAQWKSGEATEEAFAALANEKSADGDGTTGGLYENVYPGQMVAAFEDWTYDAGRKAGDTGIVETEYGFHVMYFCGNSDMTYRNYLIENELRNADLNNWYNEVTGSVTTTDGDTQYVRTDLVLSAA